MRYQDTHPWITFNLHLGRFDFSTWLLLGEAESKCEHVAGAALRPDVARQLHEVYLSKGIHGTTSIEGNTLSEAEVLARVQGDLPLPPSQSYLGTEIDNIVAACNVIVDDVVYGRPLELTPERVSEFNRQILSGLPVEEDVLPGHIRRHSVTVGGYRGAPAEDCEYLLKELCRWLSDMQPSEDNEELRFTFALVKAILAHLYIAWIHPFGDGNGRTARLIEFQLMVQAGIPLPAAHLLSDHYNRTRDRYYQELARTSKGDFPVQGFIRYALEGFVDQLREQIGTVRVQQMQVTWENYVHDLFRDRETAAGRRQKHLILDMKPGDVLPTSKLREVSTRVAVQYVGKTDKTITRDINVLRDLNLLRRTRGGWTVNRQAVEAFLPLRAEQ